ncbi:MAG: hypothetical protein ACKOAY_04995 [Haliscomenobacter sp.]
MKRQLLWIFFSIQLVTPLAAQEEASVSGPLQFSGNISATNNGISLIPSFTLGKPATLITLSAGRRLSFDPEFRVGLNGKPWSLLFWWRYKLISGSKYRSHIGIHPALVFKSSDAVILGQPQEVLLVQRFLAGEWFQSYQLFKNTSIGLHGLYSRGLKESATHNTYFVALHASIGGIALARHLHLRVVPQFYYLKMDVRDGIYTSATLSLSSDKLPVTLGSVLNRKISSQVPGKDFVWNLSINYPFQRKYAPSATTH